MVPPVPSLAVLRSSAGEGTGGTKKGDLVGDRLKCG